jgi:hypothetical protein
MAFIYVKISANKKMKMRKIVLLLVSVFALISIQVPVMAQGTILPQASPDNDCEIIISYFNEHSNEKGPRDPKVMNQMLGCAVMTGRVSLAMIPYFIQYFSNFLLGIVSLVALLFVVVGGFMYTLGGMITEQKEKGKKYVINALTGMVIAFLAWSLVNVLISALTG